MSEGCDQDWEECVQATWACLEMEAAAVELVRDVGVPMRDGVQLATDLYLPNQTPAAALVQRTPYDKLTAETVGYAHPIWYARNGFAVVCQDTRGRWRSEGDFYPYRSEACDGFDTIEWVASQPWCNGTVGMYGFSYSAATQLLAATQAPPHLSALAPAMTGSNYHEGWAYRGGMFQLAFMLGWVAGLGRDTALRERDQPAAQAFSELLSVPSSLYGKLPIRDAFPPELMRYVPYLTDWLEHPDYDNYWQQWAPREHYDTLTRPALHVSGWYDIFLEGTLENFQQLRRIGHGHQTLVVGPWSHMPWSRYVGQSDFGQEGRSSVDEIQLRFFRYWLNGEGSAIEDDPPVRLFVMGWDRWRAEDEWPPRDSTALVLHLRSDGRANSLNGTGRLTRSPPQRDEPADVCVSDPHNPVFSAGGRSCCIADIAPMGPADQRSQEVRNDVLVYDSAVLEEDTLVIGSPRLTLFFASSTLSSDFMIRLVDVHADGTAIQVSDGNMRFEQKATRGDVNKAEITMSPTAMAFRAGHRARVEITNSNFPMFDRNPNSGVSGVNASLSDFVVAMEFVFHDSRYPSRLHLPTIQ